jgi:hypothetical protein
MYSGKVPYSNYQKFLFKIYSRKGGTCFDLNNTWSQASSIIYTRIQSMGPWSCLSERDLDCLDSEERQGPAAVSQSLHGLTQCIHSIGTHCTNSTPTPHIERLQELCIASYGPPGATEIHQLLSPNGLSPNGLSPNGLSPLIPHNDAALHGDHAVRELEQILVVCYHDNCLALHDVLQ